MARSRNLANYESIYWELLEGMQAGITQIELRLPRKIAINTQQTFYAFIRANEHSANVKKIGGDIKHAQALIDDVETMRGYLATIQHDKTESVLTFVNRDLNPKTQSVRDQIREQLKEAIHTTQEEVNIKPKVDIFATPLKVTNDHEQK